VDTFDPTLVAALAGGTCCCVGAFGAALAGLSYVFRPKPASHPPVPGVAPPPRRGVQATASLTRMEEEHDAALRRPGPR
jgi:hypothetical protein